MQKVSYLILLCLSLLSAGLHAQTINEYIKFNTDYTLVVNANTDTTYELNSVEPSGDATSEGAPVKVYVPVGDPTKAESFLLKINAPNFDYIFDKTNASQFMQLPMKVMTPDSTRYLYAAVKDGSEYKVIKRYSLNALERNRTIDTHFAISPFDICSALASSANVNCTNLDTENGDTKTFLLYFYMSDSNNFTFGESVDNNHTNRFGSMFYEISMSSKTNKTVKIDIVETRKGDKRVTAFYRADSSVANPKSVRVILRDQPSLNYDKINEAAVIGASLYSKEFPFAQESSVVINELENDTTYILSLAFVDKYNFSSRLSPSFDATPMSIEELLQKEACFLLTAGFGEEHYVIDYFRSIRDNVLSQFYFGRVFITTYYDLAPKYALVIYENETIRSIIRAMAYVGYFLFNNLTLILGLSIIVLSLFVKQTKKKAI